MRVICRMYSRTGTRSVPRSSLRLLRMGVLLTRVSLAVSLTCGRISVLVCGPRMVPEVTGLIDPEACAPRGLLSVTALLGLELRSLNLLGPRKFGARGWAPASVSACFRLVLRSHTMH